MTAIIAVVVVVNSLDTTVTAGVGAVAVTSDTMKNTPQRKTPTVTTSAYGYKSDSQYYPRGWPATGTNPG